MDFWIGLVLLAIGLKPFLEWLFSGIDNHYELREQRQALLQAQDDALRGAERIHNIATFTRAVMYDVARRGSGR